MKLPLNDDGSVDVNWISPCDGGVVDIGGPSTMEFVDIEDLIQAIEAHTIERCAEVVDAGSNVDELFGYADLAEEIRNLASKGENDETG